MLGAVDVGDVRRAARAPASAAAVACRSGAWPGESWIASGAGVDERRHRALHVLDARRGTRPRRRSRGRPRRRSSGRRRRRAGSDVAFTRLRPASASVRRRSPTPSNAPTAVVASAPAAFAKRAHRSSGQPPSRPYRKPATNASPAPVPSTASTAHAGHAAVEAVAGDQAAVGAERDRRRCPLRARAAGAAARAGVALARDRHRLRASPGVTRSQCGSAGSSRSQRPLPSKTVSSEVWSPRRRASARSAAVGSPSSASSTSAPATWRARPTNGASPSSSARRASFAPVTCRNVRSPAESTSATLAEVGTLGSRITPPPSTPRSASSETTKSPNASAPTLPSADGAEPEPHERARRC